MYRDHVSMTLYQNGAAAANNVSIKNGYSLAAGIDHAVSNCHSASLDQPAAGPSGIRPASQSLTGAKRNPPPAECEHRSDSGWAMRCLTRETLSC